MFLHHKNIRVYDFSIKPTKKVVAFKGTNTNDVMRQAGFLGDSYSSKTPPKQIVAFNSIKKNDVMRQAGFLGDSYSSPFRYAKINIILFKALWEMCCASAKLI